MAADSRSDDDPFPAAQSALFDAVGLECRSRFVDLTRPQVRTQLIEAGQVGDEPPLVFVHGSGEFGAFLAPLMAHLQERELVAFDRPGYGLSDPYRYATSTLHSSLLDGITSVLDERRAERVDLVGHSMGGHAAIRYALAHPERVGHLHLVGSVPGFPGTTPPLPIRLLTVPLLRRLLRRLQTPDESGVLDVAEIFGEREAIQAYPAFIEAIVAHERDPDRAAAGFTEFNACITPVGWDSAYSLSVDSLESIACPTTVVWGDNDTLGRPAAVRAAVETIPDVRFEVVDAGHMPFLGATEACAEIIRTASKE